ncbi:hypothetical protein [Pseudonocardia halophobica]|nr:hypothetical protein [Pseudonocardia halophobica]
MLTALLPVAAIVYFAHLTCQYSNDALARVVAVVSQVLNVYFVVNSAIVYVQISSQRFLMEPFLAHNPNAFDHMDGLIGSNGASVLNFVWLATFGLNVTRIVRRQGHPALPIVVVIQLGVMADISTKNDNKMFIPMFAVFGIVLLYFVGKSSCVTGRMKGAVGASLAVLATIVISANGFLSNSGSSYRPVDNSSYVEIILPSSTVPDARNERAYLNYVAYRDYHAASLGAGLSNVDDQKQRIHVHLGINSGSLLLIQGGVIYLAGLIALMVAALVTVTVARNRIRAGDVMSIGLLILITTFASQMFRDQFSSVAIGLFFVAISTLDGQPGVEGEVRQEARSN